MKAAELQSRIESLFSHILFRYQGRDCGIDPTSRTSIDVWYGEETRNFTSVEEVMRTPFFDGKALQDICDGIDFG